MKKFILLIFWVCFSLQAKAVSMDSFFCPFLEGVPLPFCNQPKYHTCNSGYAETATYNAVEMMIKTVDDPATSTCAQTNLVCSTQCTNGPDGTSCTQSCECTSPTVKPQSCHTVCDICQQTNFYSYGITCQWLCGQPHHFPGYVDGPNGTILGQVGPQTPVCTANLVNQCAAGTSTGGPTSLSQCPNLIPQPSPFSVKNPQDCCYDPGSVADKTPGHYGVTKICGK